MGRAEEPSSKLRGCKVVPGKVCGVLLEDDYRHDHKRTIFYI